MVTIHEQNDTNFESIGLGALCPTSCIVNETLNGEYELELEHIRDISGKWKRIENNRIVCVDTPNGRQAFRIYRTKPTLKNITVNARHIFYDLLDNVILNASIKNLTGGSALNAIKNNCVVNMGFAFETDINSTGTITLENINPVSALLSNKGNSFVEIFGGEILRNNKKISILKNIGVDRGFSVRYGKNLTGLEVTEDMEGVYTRIYGRGKNGLSLPEKYIDSPYINSYPYPKIYIFEDTSLTTVSEIRNAVNSLYENGIDTPKVNIKLNFQILKNTDEYKNFAVLENIKLGDVVSVIHNDMNFIKKAKVISYEYDVLSQRYNEIELGDYIEDITTSISKGERIYNTVATASNIAQKTANAISGGITVANNELYVCIDNFDYTQSKRLFKFGAKGLQFTNQGINGQWNTIIDTEGKITEI